MRPPSLDLGPVRASGPLSSGLVDVHFDGGSLRLRRYASGLELLDRYRLVLLAAAFLFFVLSAYADGLLATGLLLAAGGAVALLAVLLVIETVLTVVAIGWGALSLSTRRGRQALVDGFRTIRAEHRGSDVVVLEPDITLMDNVHGAWRPCLVLYTTRGELRLRGWFWRRRQLEKLQRALAR